LIAPEPTPAEWISQRSSATLALKTPSFGALNHRRSREHGSFADPAFAAQHSAIPWELMYGMRNRIVHDYFEVDLEVVWQTVHKDLPKLRAQIEAMLQTRP
jgi:hypothetical protein